MLWELAAIFGTPLGLCFANSGGTFRLVSIGASSRYASETDEEENLAVPRPLTVRKQSNNIPVTDFVFGGEYDGRASANYSTEGQRKRKRLSPTLFSNDDVEILESYIHIRRRMNVHKAESMSF